MHKITDLPDDDYIDIPGLERVGYELLHNSDPRFFPALEKHKLQFYILTGTIYACFVNKLDLPEKEAFDIKWVAFYYGEWGLEQDKIIPDKKRVNGFQEVLEKCDPNKLEGLLYHLDLLTKSHKVEHF